MKTKIYKRGIRKFILTALVICTFAALAMALAPDARAAQAPGFTGRWWSVDIDGSNQKLLITPAGDEYRLKLFDDGASICGLGPDGKPLYPAIGKGKGNAAGNVLHAEFKFWCLTNPKTFWGTATVDFLYDPATDTLNDQWVVWYRIVGK